MKPSTTPYYIMWLIITLFFYLICAFISWNLKIDEWSTLIRTIFIIGAIAAIIISILGYEKEVKEISNHNK